MNIINVMNGDILNELGISSKVAHYEGDVITCYPGSNQTDDGKLQLEFNMSRFVTRVSSKNFCIVKPSFELSLARNQSTGLPQVQVGSGQASINGMDIIVTSQLFLNPPEQTGTYYIALKLARDSSMNVLGDTKIGALTVFSGVYLAYWDEKPDPMDPDMLYLGKVTWDGSNLIDIEEDEDKYGRIWAEDVLGKFLDPKHPDTRRLNLQQFIYTLPDWYFSKEGDIVYGPIEIADNRENGNTGILMNVDENGSYITIKEPNKDNDKLQIYGDLNRDGNIDQDDYDIIEQIVNGTKTPTDLEKALADLNHDGVVDEKDLKYFQNYLDYQEYLANLRLGDVIKSTEDLDLNFGDLGNIYYIDNTINQINVISSNGKNGIEINEAQIYVSKNELDNGTYLHIHNNGGICIDAEGPVKIEGDESIQLSTENPNSPKLTLGDTNISITDPDANDMSYTFEFADANTANFTLGSAIWQYTYSGSKASTGRVSLLQDNVAYLDIKPNSEFRKNIRVKDVIYIGQETVYGNENTYLKQTEFKTTDTANTNIYTSITPNITTINSDGDGTSNSGYLRVIGKNSISSSTVNDTGIVALINKATNKMPYISFQDKSNTVNLEKIYGVVGLNITGQLTTVDNITSSKNIIANQNMYITSGNKLIFGNLTSQSAYITNSGNTIVTSNGLKVGSNGQGTLAAGNTTIVGNQTISGTLTGTGNWETSGTIKGSKVFNAVYNGFGELFRKDKNEVIDFGDIICIREDGLVHKVEFVSDLNSIVGVCSDTIGIEMSGDVNDLPEDEKCPVEMLGKIWVKTDNDKLRPGQLVKALPNGKVDFTSNKQEKFGIVLTEVKDGKVKIVYNG